MAWQSTKPRRIQKGDGGACMKIALAADHGGFELKEALKERLKEIGHEVKDYGTFSKDLCDYPDFAKNVAVSIRKKESEKGILICRNGIGMSIAANRFQNIRAVTCFDTDLAKSSRFHDDTNVLCLGADMLNINKALKISSVWLSSPFDNNERRLRRINKMDDLI